MSQQQQTRSRDGLRTKRRVRGQSDGCSVCGRATRCSPPQPWMMEISLNMLQSYFIFKYILQKAAPLHWALTLSTDNPNVDYKLQDKKSRRTLSSLFSKMRVPRLLLEQRARVDPILRNMTTT